jgi:GNAT superfamily N-acetyltransferase
VTAVVLREPRPGDGAALARMAEENAAYYAEQFPDDFRVPDEEGRAAFMEPAPEENTETSLALVAELDGKVAGYLEAQIEPPLESARYQSNPELGERRLFINYVGTRPQFWRRGVATKLVEAAEEWGRARGATIALCDTYLDSPVSLPFWEQRMGYRRRSVRLTKRLGAQFASVDGTASD